MATPKATKKSGPKPGEAVVQAGFRAPQALLDRLDAWAEKLNETTHARWTRNGIILAVVERALDERGAKGEAP